MAPSWSTTRRCTPSAVLTGMMPSGATLQNSYISVSPRDGCTSPTRPRQPYIVSSFVLDVSATGPHRRKKVCPRGSFRRGCGDTSTAELGERLAGVALVGHVGHAGERRLQLADRRRLGDYPGQALLRDQAVARPGGDAHM